MGLATRILRKGRYVAAPMLWNLRTRTITPDCPVCDTPHPSRRVGYGRPFLQCTSCGFLWCHDWPTAVETAGMGLAGSWGGPEKGGERDDFLVRLLNEDHKRRRVLIYGAGTTLVFRVLHDEGFDIYGADIGPDVVAYRAREFPGRFLQANDLAISELGFDIITACEVFEHLHEPRRWIGSLVHNLTPNGVLCGSTNFYPGSGSIEDDQRLGYMSTRGHVAYWSATSFDQICGCFGMQTVVFEMVSPGSVKPDPTYGMLFPNKRVFFASRDEEIIDRLRTLKETTPILPIDTNDYPIAAYRQNGIVPSTEQCPDRCSG